MQWRELTSVEKIAVLFVVVLFVWISLAAILGPYWFMVYALPVVVLVGGSYGALTVARSMKEGPRRIVAYGVAVVLILALVGGCVVDATSIEDVRPSPNCPIDWYLWVIPVNQVCF